jgi:hypothetical protein
MIIFSPKDPNESFPVSFDFSALLPSVTNATVTVSLLGGADPSPSSLLHGAPQVSGAAVRQRIKGGVHNCQYKIVCQATNGVDTFVQAAQLRVRSV